MTNEERVLKAAAAIGVTDVEYSAHDIDAWSPKGYIFAATGCHTVVQSRWDDEGATQIASRFVADMRAGLLPCDGGDKCEGCENSKPLELTK